jgi:iron complex transport system substrate-binding protein
MIRWLAVSAILMTSACAGGERAAPLQDDGGRPIVVARPPERIVSLSPATTELLFALGAGDRLVGRTRFDEDPAAALAIPSVGDGLQPNVEVVLATRPDLVVFYEAVANTPAIERIEQTGTRVVGLRLDGLDDLVRATRLLGSILGARDRSDSLIDDLRVGLDAASQANRAVDSAALLAWTEPPIVIGRASFLSEIAGYAGLENVFDDVARASATVSIETLAARRPGFLILGRGSAESVRQRPQWHAIDAVREGRIVVVHGTHFSHPSFRAPAAIRELRALVEQVAR